MLNSRIGKLLLMVLGTLSVAAYAETGTVKQIDVPAGQLTEALKTLAEQSGVQLVYSTEQVEGVKTQGVQGELTAEQAAAKLLEGTNLKLTIHESGALAIVAVQGRTASETHGGNGSGLRVAQVDAAAGTTASQQGAQQPQDAADSAGSAEDTQLEEILVTAQKREERLQDVPVPVSILETQSFAANNQVRIEDYFAKVPGLNLTPAIQSAQILSIRGITTGAGNPTVGVVVDDIPYGASASLGGGNRVPDIDPGELERIEVLKGPQGTLYGASSMGGLFKFVTRDPSVDGVTGRVQAATSSADGSSPGYAFRGSANLPLSDTVAVRVNGFKRLDPGYIDNTVTGQDDINEADATGGRLGFLWRPSSDLAFKLNALYQKIQGDGASLVTVGPGFADLEQGTVRNTGQYDREAQAYSAILNANLGKIGVTSLTGYNVNAFDDVYDASAVYAAGFGQPNFGVSGVQLTNDNETQKFSQELRLTMPVGQAFEVMLGGFYSDEESTFRQQVLAADPVQGVPVGTIALNSFPTTFKEYAAFGNVTVRFTDRFDLQIGGRQSWIEQTFAQNLTGLLGNLILPESSADFEPFTYLVTPRFQVSSDLMLYARIASGFRAGGLNAGLTPVPPFGPDKTRNYEVGMKSSVFDRKLSFDFSVYQIDWTGIQLRVTNPPPTRTENAGEARSRGVELTVDLRPTDALTISTAASWNDAEASEDFPSDSSLLGLKGNALPNSPEFCASASVDQKFALTSNVSGSIGASMSYVGSRLGDFRSRATPPLPRQELPGYTRADLRAGLGFDSWEANLFVNNVFDKRGVLAGGLGQTPPNGFYYIQPRTIGLSLTREF